MKLTESFTFTAAPDKVAAMMVDPEFAKQVGREIHATHFQSRVVPNGLAATYVIPTPEKASRFVGSEVTLIDIVTWTSATQGRMVIQVQGMPASVDGPITLRPDPSGCVATYNAELRVKIPFLGAQLEKMAMKYMTQTIGAVERVGNRWLAQQ